MNTNIGEQFILKNNLIYNLDDKYSSLNDIEKKEVSEAIQSLTNNSIGNLDLTTIISIDKKVTWNRKDYQDITSILKDRFSLGDNEIEIINSKKDSLDPDYDLILNLIREYNKDDNRSEDKCIFQLNTFFNNAEFSIDHFQKQLIIKFKNQETFNHFSENYLQHDKNLPVKTSFQPLEIIIDSREKDDIDDLRTLLIAFAVETEKELYQQLTEEEQKKYREFRNYEIQGDFNKKYIQEVYSDIGHLRNILNESDNYDEFYRLIAMDPKLIDILGKIPKDDAGEKWENYIVRKSDFNKKFDYASSDQKEYGTMMHRTVQAAGAYLKDIKPDCESLLNFLSYRRKKIALTLNPNANGSKAMGRIRYIDARSSCNQDYIEISARLRERVSMSPTKYIIENDENYTPGLVSLKQLGLINDKLIELSELDLWEKVHLGKTGVISHTKWENAAIVMEYVKNDLYPKALQEEDPQKLAEDLGRIFWWICQAKPWERGDPSIAETLIRGIWAYRGMENPPWKENIIPWVEVTVEPDVEEFAKKFASRDQETALFEWR